MKEKKEELKETKKVEKKNNGLLVTILVVVLLGVFFAFGYLVGAAKLSEKVVEVNTSQEEETQEEKSFDISKAKEILNEFGFYKTIGCNSNILEGIYGTEFKILHAIEKVDSSKVTETTCSAVYTDADLTDVYGMTEKVYKGNKVGYCTEDTKTKTISYDDANKVYKKLYGTEMPKEGSDGLKVNSMYYTMYDYVGSKNLYASTHCVNCGGSCGPSMRINEIKSAKEIGNRLYVEVYYYHNYPQSINGNEYYDLETAKTFKNINEAHSVEEFNNIVKSKYLDLLDIYEIEFEKNNEDYILVKVSKKASE